MENPIGFLLPIMAVGVIGQFIFFTYQWMTYKTQTKIIVSVALLIQVLGITALFLLSWGTFPWGRTSAFETADRFLTAMKQENYMDATQYMQSCVRDFSGVDSLGNPKETKPISWQWTAYENHNSFVSTIGTAKFIDNAELRVEIKLKWSGLKWEVYGATFGDPYKDYRVQFSWSCKNIFDFWK